MLKILWIWKIEISGWTPNSPLQTGGSLFFGGGGVNCLEVFLPHFNPNNSLLILLLIIYMKMLFDSDWLRAVQFKCNTPVQITHRSSGL